MNQTYVLQTARKAMEYMGDSEALLEQVLQDFGSACCDEEVEVAIAQAIQYSRDRLLLMAKAIGVEVD